MSKNTVIDPETVAMAGVVSDSAQAKEEGGRKGLRAWFKGHKVPTWVKIVLVAAAVVVALWELLLLSSAWFAVVIAFLSVAALGWAAKKFGWLKKEADVVVVSA